MSDVAREAEWLVKEETEVAVARREGYVLSPQFFWRAKHQTFLAATMAAFLIGASAWATLPHGLDFGFVFWAVAGLSLGLIPLARHWEKRQEASREADREMRESFGRGGRFVSMIVLQGDAPTGEDRGMLWFEDGRLYFSGHRTSFGLVPAQIRGKATLTDRLPGVRNEVVLFLDREGPAGWSAVSFSVPVPQGAYPHSGHRELARDIDAWRKTEAVGPGQWPPFARGPGVISERSLLARAATRTALLPLIPAVVCEIIFRSGIGYAIYLVCAVKLVKTDSSKTRLLLRAFRDRRRLERSQWKT